MCEVATPNPFLDYRLQVSFTTPGGRVFDAPGFFAADGNAAETSDSCGDKWRAYLLPDETGLWSYTVSFRTGSDISVDTAKFAGTPIAPLDGYSDTFSITPTDKTGKDFRAKGLLKYVGEYYLRFAETGEYYLKGGADSPENFLGYFEFDGTYNLPGGEPDQNLINGLHRYEPHVQDWLPGDPVWQNGKGKGIIGILNYLASQEGNSVYFLTYNIDGGDGMDTWIWNHPDERKRFDCSKLDQWEIVFEHMDRLGIQLHLVTQEVENDQELNNGSLGLERKLYYRELVARFAHHPALQWNLGEESSNSIAALKDFAGYIRHLDPYHHPITFHIRNDQLFRYDGVLGNENFECTSLQSGITNSYNGYAKLLRERSDSAGRRWAIYGDEQQPPVNSTLSALNTLRRTVLWGNLMGGGAGVEWYFGYHGSFGDIQSEDWRIVEPLWQQTAYAIRFFQNHLPFHEMMAHYDLVSNTDAYCFTKPDSVYVIYLYNGQSTHIELPDAFFQLRWFDPRNDNLVYGGIISGNLNTLIHQPPYEQSLDWVAWLEIINPDETPVSIAFSNPANGAVFNEQDNIHLEVALLDFSGSVQKVEYYIETVKAGESAVAPFAFLQSGLGVGTYNLTAVAIYDDSLSSASETITIYVSEETEIPTIFTLINSDSNTDIGNLFEGKVINLYTTGNKLNIRADFDLGNERSVIFGLNQNPNFNTENAAPWAMAGDNNNGNYYNWTPALGNYTVTATAYSGLNGKGDLLASHAVSFTVINQSTDCNGTIGGTALPDDCGECAGGLTGHQPNADKDCNGVCFGAAFFDDCKVCAGGSTGIPPCNIDCNGDLDGEALPDDCNVCSGGNTGQIPNEDKDCFGDCFGMAFIDSCGVCAGGNTGNSPCVEDCNGDLGCSAFFDDCNICSAGNTGHISNSDKDDCGICFGNNENKDCFGDCFGSAYIDSCGYCAGGNTGSAPCIEDCHGDFGGTAFFDDCNICSEGNTGHIANSNKDECGICFGNNENKDCFGDCFGVAVIDDCGNCTGGNSGVNPCYFDCNGDLGGVAFLDDCNVCSSGNTSHVANADKDCNDDCFGTAFIDECGNCAGGNTEISPCFEDCNSDFGGTAFFDDCNICSEGNTGHSANSNKDDCGVCFGNDENKDCDGDCFGTAYIDDCNVCAGGNTGVIPNSCAVDCEVSAWSAWSACSESCGEGIQTRTRTILVHPQFGSAACPILVETQSCNTQACASCQLTVVTLMLINTNNNEEIRPLKAQDTVNLFHTPNINIRADVCSPTGSVRFFVNNSLFRNENVAPYAIAGDGNGNYYKWNVSTGFYAIRVTPYSSTNGNGTEGISKLSDLTIILQEAPQCTVDSDCSDNLPCTTDACLNGVCVYTPVNCNDDNACTVDFCNDAGQCVHTPLDCDDNNPCTIDECDSVEGCVYTWLEGCCNTNTDCNDGDPCTQDICTGNVCNYEAGGNEPSYLKIINPSMSWRKLKLGYAPNSLWNPRIDVTASGNTQICITLRVPNGVADWSKIEIRPQGSSNALVILSNYIQQPIPDWTTICIPLSDFGSINQFRDLSFIESPYCKGAGAFELHLQKIIFTGGAVPFLWFGDSKTDNSHDGGDGSGSGLIASLVEGNPCATAKLSEGETELNMNASREIMLQAFPNPFSNSVAITFSLPEDETVRIEIVSADGKYNMTLFDEKVISEKTYTLHFHPGNLAEGMYFYRLITGQGNILNKKLLLMR